MIINVHSASDLAGTFQAAGWSYTKLKGHSVSHESSYPTNGLREKCPVPDVRLEIATALLSGEYPQCDRNLKQETTDSLTSDQKAMHCVQGVILDVLALHGWGNWSKTNEEYFEAPWGDIWSTGAPNWVIADALGIDLSQVFHPESHAKEAAECFDDDCDVCNLAIGDFLIDRNDNEYWEFERFADFIKEELA